MGTDIVFLKNDAFKQQQTDRYNSCRCIFKYDGYIRIDIKRESKYGVRFIGPLTDQIKG